MNVSGMGIIFGMWAGEKLSVYEWFRLADGLVSYVRLDDKYASTIFLYTIRSCLNIYNCLC